MPNVNDFTFVLNCIEIWVKWRSDCGLGLTVDDTDNANDVSLQDGGSDREYNSEFIKRDETLWNEAAKLAIQLDSQKGIVINTSNTLPQIMCNVHLRRTDIHQFHISIIK